TVSPTIATHFTISAPSAAVAGSAFAVAVTALDPFGNTATGYAGAVHLTSTDPRAVLPPDGPLSAGVGTFPVTLRTARSWTATAGSVKLSGANVERVVVSGDGQVVVADVGAGGLRRWTASAGGWVKLSGANVQNVVVSADGGVVVADFGAGGLKLWTASDGWV